MAHTVTTSVRPSLLLLAAGLSLVLAVAWAADDDKSKAASASEEHDLQAAVASKDTEGAENDFVSHGKGELEADDHTDGKHEEGHGEAEVGHGEGGHEDEEGHGEGGHEGVSGHEEHHASSVTLMTVSYLLIGFLVSNFVLLWLVNWPDAHIRSFAWKMISGTVSIYLAVLLNGTMCAFVIYWVTGSVSSAEEFTFVEFGIHMTLFLTFFVTGNFMCYYFREAEDPLFATAVIGGHITAFAGILVVESLLKLKLESSHCSLIAGVVLAFLAVLRLIVGTVRIKISDAGNPDEQDEEWLEKICEAEDDACSIISSYAIMQAIMKLLFSVKSHEHSLEDIRTISLAELACILALVGVTYWRKLVEGKHQGKQFALTIQSRAVNSVQITVAMTMSWLALHLFFWMTAYWLPGVEHEFMEIISAAVLTVVSIVGILVLDKVADKTSTEAVKQDESEESKDSKGPMVEARDRSTSDAMGDVGGQVMKDQWTHSLVISFSSTSDAMGDVGSQVMKEALDLDNLEKALRVLIDALSLAVGLSWEHAFHASLHTIVVSNVVMQKHQIWANFTMAAASFLLMLPVWLKIIAKMANRPAKWFQDNMDAEETRLRQRQDLQNKRSIYKKL